MILNKFIRENIELVKSSLKNRQVKDYNKIIDELLLTDKQYRSNLELLENLKNKRNLISKEISTLDKKSNNFQIKSKEVLNFKKKIKNLEEDLVKLKERLRAERLKEKIDNDTSTNRTNSKSRRNMVSKQNRKNKGRWTS